MKNIETIGQLVNFITVVVQNKFVDLIRKNKHSNVEIITENFIDSISTACEIKNLESELTIKDLLKSLTKNQKWVIEQIFITTWALILHPCGAGLMPDKVSRESSFKIPRDLSLISRIRDSFIFQKTEIELAKEKGVTKQAINNTKKQAFKRMKYQLEREM
ncbi:MAG: hypothetical protein COA82_13435 [Alkaliphilus sp.]|nr:MAG: hypothetical protein COA82_13435 [Alkaliphilus sp.]